MLGVSWITSLLAHYDIEIIVNMCPYCCNIRSFYLLWPDPPPIPIVPKLPYTVHDTPSPTLLPHTRTLMIPRPHHRPAPSNSTQPTPRFILQLPGNPPSPAAPNPSLPSLLQLLQFTKPLLPTAPIEKWEDKLPSPLIC